MARESAYLKTLPSEINFKAVGLVISFKPAKTEMIKIIDGPHSVFVEPRELEDFIQVLEDIKEIYQLMLNNEQEQQRSVANAAQ